MSVIEELFAEELGIVLEISAPDENSVMSLLNKANVICHKIGHSLSSCETNEVLLISVFKWCEVFNVYCSYVKYLYVKFLYVKFYKRKFQIMIFFLFVIVNFFGILSLYGFDVFLGGT